MNKFNTLLFADDTTLTLSNGSVHELEKSINSEVTNIVTWKQANKPTINFKKTPILFSSVINAKIQHKYVLFSAKYLPSRLC